MALLSVLRFIPMGVFDDATVRNIGRAFDLACKELNDAGQPDVVHEVRIKKSSRLRLRAGLEAAGDGQQAEALGLVRLITSGVLCGSRM